MAEALKESRAKAQRHRTLADLYDRLGACEALEASLQTYSERLADLDEQMARLRKQINELEATLPPVPPAPPRVTEER
jgi:predicted  nucleic acid-binding Zn-ribbon protein